MMFARIPVKGMLASTAITYIMYMSVASTPKVLEIRVLPVASRQAVPSVMIIYAPIPPPE